MYPVPAEIFYYSRFALQDIKKEIASSTNSSLIGNEESYGVVVADEKDLLEDDAIGGSAGKD